MFRAHAIPFPGDDTDQTSPASTSSVANSFKTHISQNTTSNILSSLKVPGEPSWIKKT